MIPFVGTTVDNDGNRTAHCLPNAIVNMILVLGWLAEGPSLMERITCEEIKIGGIGDVVTLFRTLKMRFDSVVAFKGSNSIA